MTCLTSLHSRIAELQQGLADCRALGQGLLAHRLVEIADVYRHTGQTQAGSDVLSEMSFSEEKDMDAELYRLRDQHLLQAEDTLRAEGVTPDS